MKYNTPEKLVRRETELKGMGFDKMKEKIAYRVFLLADSLYDTMNERDAGRLTYDIGGEMYVMKHNHRVDFAKGGMCSPGIATQAEDLFAAGVQELIDAITGFC